MKKQTMIFSTVALGTGVLLAGCNGVGVNAATSITNQYDSLLTSNSTSNNSELVALSEAALALSLDSIENGSSFKPDGTINNKVKVIKESLTPRKVNDFLGTIPSSFSLEYVKHNQSNNVSSNISINNSNMNGRPYFFENTTIIGDNKITSSQLLGDDFYKEDRITFDILEGRKVTDQEERKVLYSKYVNIPYKSIVTYFSDVSEMLISGEYNVYTRDGSNTLGNGGNYAAYGVKEYNDGSKAILIAIVKEEKIEQFQIYKYGLDNHKVSEERVTVKEFE